ncbi:hypothetical protein A2U01_0063911, partial [Trifolium medium]|nr:hypothetical protein [Trifolium medium]
STAQIKYVVDTYGFSKEYSIKSAKSAVGGEEIVMQIQSGLTQGSG